MLLRIGFDLLARLVSAAGTFTKLPAPPATPWDVWAARALLLWAFIPDIKKITPRPIARHKAKVLLPAAVLLGALNLPKYSGFGAALAALAAGALLDVLRCRAPLLLSQTRLGERRSFLVCVVSMLALVLKGDPARATSADKALDGALGRLGVAQEKRAAIARIFHDALSGSTGLSAHAANCYKLFRYKPAMLRAAIDMLIDGALVDGELSPEKERLIAAVAEVFGFRDAAFRRVLAQHGLTGAGHRSQPESDRRTAEDAFEAHENYRILGIDPTASAAALKSAYRALAKNCHPDRLRAQGLPEELYDDAHERFVRIQRAYETIRAERGL